MGSLAEELGAALDGVELPASDEPSTEIVETAAAVETVDTGTARDEQGRFAAKREAQEVKPETTEAKPVVEQTEQTNTETQEPKTIAAPPATWSAGAKAIYSTLPEVARKEIAKREQDYARGIQQHAEAAKGYNTLMREFQPYEAMIRAENGTPEIAIRSLLQTAYQLRSGTPQDRGNLVMQIARQFGADLTPHLQGRQEQPDGQNLSQVQTLVQQMVAPHLQKIQSWEQQQAQAQQNQHMQLEQETKGQIEAFQSATNEDGSPKHLYFENVKGLMSAYFANGQAQSLEQAYDMACWANPEVRAALQADMQRSAEAQRLAEAKRKAQEAGKAGFNVSGQGSVGISGATQTSLEDTIAEKLAQARGGARV